MRRIVAGAACLALLVLVVTPFASDATRRRTTPQVVLKTVDGPDIAIPPSSVNEADYIVKCPRGWQTTGFGVLNGATDIVFADPTSDGRGYDFAFGNSDNTTSFTASGNVRCEKGKHLKVRKASASGDRRKAVRDWLAAYAH